MALGRGTPAFVWRAIGTRATCLFYFLLETMCDRFKQVLATSILDKLAATRELRLICAPRSKGTPRRVAW
jgi:hypothetical protein